MDPRNGPTQMACEHLLTAKISLPYFVDLLGHVHESNPLFPTYLGMQHLHPRGLPFQGSGCPSDGHPAVTGLIIAAIPVLIFGFFAPYLTAFALGPQWDLAGRVAALCRSWVPHRRWPRHSSKCTFAWSSCRSSGAPKPDGMRSRRSAGGTVGFQPK
jgi:hypothetical protein